MHYLYHVGQKANVRKITWLTVIICILKTCKLWLEVEGREQVYIPISVAMEDFEYHPDFGITS